MSCGVFSLVAHPDAIVPRLKGERMRLSQASIIPLTLCLLTRRCKVILDSLAYKIDERYIRVYVIVVGLAMSLVLFLRTH